MTAEELTAAIARIDAKLDKRRDVAGYQTNVAALEAKRAELQAELDALNV